MKVSIVEGNILDQNVEVIVNTWNRNIIPWWLLIPQGVSAAIKKRAGYQPFIAVARHGPIPLGHAVLTSAGKLPYKGIIHVAGINIFWRSSEKTIRACIRSAMTIVNDGNFASVAVPIIGSGSGGFNQTLALQIMLDELSRVETRAQVLVIKYLPPKLRI